jgi:hypothetical protein
MKRNLTISMLVSATVAFAGQRVTVAVCNVDELPAQVIEHAEAEATYVFQAMDVEIHWTECGAEVGAKDARIGPDFIIRVRVGRHITKAGPWLRWMLGQAFMDPGGAGVMADVYYGTIEELVHLYPVVGGDQVLGYSMAHELGHLLIGPGHARKGIMQAPWGKKELDAIKRSQLQFSEAERATILRKLGSRAAGSNAPPGNDRHQA